MTRKNKKGVSLMIAYALLIVIAIGLSVGVYMWLNDFIPNIGGVDECPEGVSIVILEYSCLPIGDRVELTVKNEGRFNIDGYYIKGTNKTDNVADVNLRGIGDLTPGIHSFSPELEPNEKDTAVFSYPTGELNKIEIEPFRIQEKKEGVKKDIIVLCTDALLNQEIDGCN